MIEARLALNYKGIPYLTEWVEYPDLKPKFQSLGLQPNNKSVSVAEYSSPVVRMTDGTYVMDSRKIADTLEKLQPEPSLHLDSEHVDRVQKVVLAVWVALTPIAIPRVPELLLNHPSADYFRETRAKRFGMPLTELAKSDKARDAFTTAEAPMNDLKTILQEHDDGPNVLGKQPSYADLIVAAMWRCAERLDKDGDFFGKAMQFDPVFAAQYEACREWLQKDD